MKLLIVTQKVDINDDILGFFHRWIEEFAKHCEKLTVICLEEGKHNFYSVKNAVSRSENSKEFSGTGVKILSLGKEEGVSKLTYLKRFYQYIWQERRDYDTVFVHMNPEYIVWGGLFWRLSGKKINLWYTHRQVNLKLRIALVLSKFVFSASGFSFGIKSKKLHILGHGIDVNSFECPEKKYGDIVKIISVGRIAKIKNCDVLVKSTEVLKERWNKKFKVIFVGDPVTATDEEYLKYLKQLVYEKGLENEIDFVGSVPNNKMKEIYCKADISSNMAPTGGVDKVVIESMAAGLPVFVSNEAFREYFDCYADDLIFNEGDWRDLAEKIINLFDINKRKEITTFLQKQSKENFGVQKLILNIVELLK